MVLTFTKVQFAVSGRFARFMGNADKSSGPTVASHRFMCPDQKKMQFTSTTLH